MTRERWITLLVVSAATAMLLLDVTVVNVALPAIRADLDASFGEMQWVIDAYARPSQFREANRVGFEPVIASLELSDRVTPDPAPGKVG